MYVGAFGMCGGGQTSVVSPLWSAIRVSILPPKTHKNKQNPLEEHVGVLVRFGELLQALEPPAAGPGQRPARTEASRPEEDACVCMCVECVYGGVLVLVLMDCGVRGKGP